MPLISIPFALAGITVPDWIAYYAAKKEGVLAHLWFGMLVPWPIWAKGGQAWAGVLVVTGIGIAWEILSYFLSDKEWKPAALDVIPFTLGGIITWASIAWGF